MKRGSKKVVRSSSAKIADPARVRLGSMSPSFTVSAPTKKISDKGKVRLGSMSPSF
jgi:hypothetical protein